MNTLGIIALYAAFGLFLLLLAFPGAESGKRLLKGWRVPDPTLEQGQVAANYLAVHRRTWLLAYFGGGFALAQLDPPIDGFLLILPAILFGLLVAELVSALWPRRGSAREATLVRRSLRDLLTIPGIVGYLLMLGFALTGAIALLVARPWARTMHVVYTDPTRAASWNPFSANANWQPVWTLLGTLALLTITVITIVALAYSRRSLRSDPIVDAALRTRSARVALAVGLLLTSILGVAIMDRVGNLNVLEDQFIKVDGPAVPGWLDSIALYGGFWSLIGVLVAIVGAMALVTPIRPRLVKALTE